MPRFRRPARKHSNALCSIFLNFDQALIADWAEEVGLQCRNVERLFSSLGGTPTWR